MTGRNVGLLFVENGILSPNSSKRSGIGKQDAFRFFPKTLGRKDKMPKTRLRSYMDSEIRAIMAQYMPLDSQGEVPNHSQEDHA